ncbi:MAG: peptidylprolyl isomerase [Oscillospiraceae bacterium]|nr:peptidylprolyl isomerase [Oscillospiraceae bacterium]MBR3534725.1 peptidylprolyl isomerase [Oscillospiraceae bacterium]MBR6835683.1 peptidylprolyl isomerase [Oscillospiraceae bacterium]
MKQNGKRFISGVFAAMAVFTAAMMVTTVVNINNQKKVMALTGEENLVQEMTLEGNIADDALITVISTDHGDIAAELYTKYAPETVANFRELAESGYYDDTFVYAVQKGINAGFGSKYDDGDLPENYDKKVETVKPEITKDLWPVKGALLSAGLTHGTLWRGQETYSGSRFIIPGSIDFKDEEVKKQLEALLNADNVSESDTAVYESAKNLINMFCKYGGTPNVSQKITVFGQTFDGWDVLDSIMNEPSDEKTLIPKKEIAITGVKFMTYAEYNRASDK